MRTSRPTSLPAVLVYHAVCPRPARRIPGHGLVVDPAQFEWQMADLDRRGFRAVTLDQYAAGLEGAELPQQSVLLTFDDAYAHLDQSVTHVLQRHGFTAAVFASWESLVERDGPPPDQSALEDLGVVSPEQPALIHLRVATPKELAAMAAGPWEVGSHALSHVDLRNLEPERMLVHLRRAREYLSALLARPVLDLAYPYGHQDARVRRAARLAGYRMAFTVGHGDSRDRYQLPRQLVNADDGPLIFRLATHPRAYPWVRLAGDRVPNWLKHSLRASRQVMKKAIHV